MKVTEVKFARKFNIGNYESKEYAITAILEDEEAAGDVFKNLEGEINSAYSGEEQGETNAETRSAGKSGKVAGKGSKGDDSTDTEEEEIEGEEGESEDEAGNEEEEETDDETEEVDSDESEDSVESTGKTGKKPSKKSSPSTGSGGKAGKAAGKKFKKKPQVYQRSNETHKEIFSSILKSVAPNWKKDEKSKSKAKTTSTKLEGEEFLDEDGEVLESFKQSVKKSMGVSKK